MRSEPWWRRNWVEEYFASFHSGTMVAAPGLPCALTPDALAEHRDRILHDALEIGTATMAVQSAAELAGGSAIKKAGEG
ncbi:hypothetical protein ACFL0I_05520 [Gemmatimonadota bacterium]